MLSWKVSGGGKTPCLLHSAVYAETPTTKLARGNVSAKNNHTYNTTATAYTLKAFALAGAFYCFNSLTNPTNQPPIPGTIERSKY